jgi:hypothetical protein
MKAAVASVAADAVKPAPVPARSARKSRTFTVKMEVEPGQVQEVTVPAAALTRWGVCRLRITENQRIVQDFKTWTGYYRLTEKPERDLGLPFHWQWYIVMGYLGKFFKVTRPSPAVTLVEIQSLLAHIEAASDESFWTEERVARWQSARREYNGKLHKIAVGRGQRAADPRPVEAKAGKPSQQLELF